MFGLGKTPTVNNEQNIVLLHLLSPGFKPIQITSDLENFWNETYFEVKKELKNRYPKHVWPDDPWNETATSRVKRRN
jgi:ATP-dependent helicase HrpB